MKHLELSRRYFKEYGQPMIEKYFPMLKGKYAAGLVGEGSGCFGYDDLISRDHDFGPGFCLWLSDPDFSVFGADLQSAYDDLPSGFMGYCKSNISDKSRLGVMSVGDFYERFTGCRALPETNMDWFLISEANLSCVTNGSVFTDGSGAFSKIRSGFLRFYPQDVLLKKIAARAAVISQSGQYNLPRCLKRGEKSAAALAAAKFAEASASMVHLLEKKPMPFYKWAFRSLRDLEAGGGPETGSSSEAGSRLAVSADLDRLLSNPLSGDAPDIAEKVCTALAAALIEKGYCSDHGSFLQNYVPQLMESISDKELRDMHPMADCL